MEEISKELEFFLYLLECYAKHKNMYTGEVLNLWNEKKITKKIYDNYWLYHTESLENAYEDIDNLLENGNYAW